MTMRCVGCDERFIDLKSFRLHGASGRCATRAELELAGLERRGQRGPWQMNGVKQCPPKRSTLIHSHGQ